MKVGLLTSYLAIGDQADSGLGQHFRILADSLVDAGHEVHVVYIATKAAERPAELLQSLSPRWSYDIVSPKPPKALLRLLSRSWPSQFLAHVVWQARAAETAVIAASIQHGFRVIETHAYNMPALFLLRRKRRPRVLTRVSTTSAQILPIMPVRSRVLKWHAEIERAATNRSDALVTHSINHRDTICKLEGYNADRFTIIPHGIPDPGNPVAPKKADAESVNFLFVGRFEPRKGIDVLLNAIPTVASACPRARFTLAGTKDEKLWEGFAQKNPALAATRTQCLGKVSPQRLTELYRECDVLVAPSRYESFGLIYAEAMSHGRPSIGCAVGGIPEVVTDGETGFLARPGDSGSLAACMIRLAENASLRREMGDAARKDFLRRFSDKQLAASSVAYYSSLPDFSATSQSTS